MTCRIMIATTQQLRVTERRAALCEVGSKDGVSHKDRLPEQLRVTVACETFGELDSDATLAVALRANSGSVEAATDALLTAPPPPPQQPQQPLPPLPPAVAPPESAPAPPPQPAAPQPSSTPPPRALAVAPEPEIRRHTPPCVTTRHHALAVAPEPEPEPEIEFDLMSGDRGDFDFMSGGGGEDDEADCARPDAPRAEAEAELDACRAEPAKVELLGRGGDWSAPEPAGAAGSTAASDGMASPSGSSVLGPPSAIRPWRGGLSGGWLQLKLTIAERDKAIAARDAIITAIITAAKAQLRARDERIATRDEILFAADATLVERDRTIAERDATIAERVATITERDATIAKHVATISERGMTLAERDETIAVGNMALGELRDFFTATAAKHRAALRSAKHETQEVSNDVSHKDLVS